MKKIFTSLAILATFVGCVKESTPAIENSPATMSVVASIDCEATRVTVEGEKFTDVKWEQGDLITLVSEAGVNVVMQAESAGDSDVRFNGSGTYAAEVDTYYAVYPAVEIAGRVATIDLSKQSANDAAMLVSTTRGAKQDDITMSFEPANSLLHVAVSGVESLAKAEFKSFDGSDIASSFSYDFSTEETSMGGSTKAYVVENPAVEGFFFSLPANLDMNNGYIVTLTDGAGNVCSKAYNGKVFERGTTTRVAIEWSQPTVTFGSAMTSYSYYLSGNSAQANSCANNVIYFMPSTYANLQGAMIAEAGYIVDGQTYAATIDTATKSFSGNVAVSSWGAKSVKTYVKTKDGKTFESEAETVHITGLPYSYNFEGGSLGNYQADGWTTNGKMRVSSESLAGRTSTLVLHHRRYSKVIWVLFDEEEKGYVVSPKFVTPSDIAVQPMVARSAYNASGDKTRTGYVGPVTNTSSSSQAIKYTTSANNGLTETIIGSGEWMSSFVINSSMPYISLDCVDDVGNALGAYYFLHEVAFRYAE